ncbi:hypothetical protein WUBG_04114 [Wuchereria bancrofti]|uniref:Uncharacterized protein n=1 Tax=Wuchereria bancrofti TaxID=6293 RepID=J9F644_WUCBA|nr:hypothetical protein WUBG_04114 [Wuchereria bancrofti]
MKLFKITLVVMLMQIIEADIQEDVNEKIMNENLTLWDDCEEIMELDESVEQQTVSEIPAVKISRNTKASRNTESSSITNDKFFDTKTSNSEDTSIAMNFTTIFPNSKMTYPSSEKIEATNLFILPETISKVEHNDLEISTSMPSVISGSLKPFSSSVSLANEMDKMNISTTPNVISLTINDIMNASFNSKIDETFELQLSMDKSDGRNESEISIIDSIYLTEEESITFCQKTLACEKKLKWHELMCQRQYAYPNLIIVPETKLFDMSVQSEFITNSEVTNVMESVSKACLRPITSDILRQLSKLLHKMELSRKLCMRQTVSSQNPLPIHNVTF